MKTAEEFLSFNQGNLEALIKSGQIMATGMQDLGKQVAATAQARLKESMATFKALGSVKSVKEPPSAVQADRAGDRAADRPRDPGGGKVQQDRLIAARAPAFRLAREDRKARRQSLRAFCVYGAARTRNALLSALGHPICPDSDPLPAARQRTSKMGERCGDLAQLGASLAGCCMGAWRQRSVIVAQVINPAPKAVSRVLIS